jgi:hypothetical protein
MEELCHLSAIIYGIWFARNKLVFDNIDTDDKEIIEKALTSTMDYQKANLNPTKQEYGNNNKQNYNYNHNNRYSRSNQQAHHRSAQNNKWKKPSNGKIKANCDANLSNEGSWGLGAIFRDEEGQILASATWEIPGFNDPTTAEACALYFSTRLALDCCFTSVDFESDNSIVVKLVENPVANPRSYLGNLIKGIKINRALLLHSSFSHIDREANSVAHELAALAHLVHNCIWMEETHPNIVPFVLRDLIH